jgi:hypothetical protein
VQRRTTDQTAVAEYGPWRVTTRTIRTVERLRQRPRKWEGVQPVYRFRDGQPIPSPAAVPGGPPRQPYKLSDPDAAYDDSRNHSIRSAARITGIEEWQLWAGWLAVHAGAVDNLPPLRPLRRRRDRKWYTGDVAAPGPWFTIKDGQPRPQWNPTEAEKTAGIVLDVAATSAATGLSPDHLRECWRTTFDFALNPAD